MEEKYVGIDIHRDYGVACVQDQKGEILDEFRFGNNIEGINKVKEKLGNNNSHIAIESTGNMWVVLWDKLEEVESDLHLVHPLKTKAIASNKCRVKKRSFNLPLLIKLHEQISRMQLSFGLSLCRRWIHSAVKKEESDPILLIAYLGV